MKFKRVLSLMLAVLAIASSVVSCSKKEKKETPVSVPTEEKEPEFTVIDGEGRHLIFSSDIKHLIRISS